MNYQVDYCLNFAKQNGISIDIIYVDNGFSANGERPEFHNMMSNLDSINTIVIKDISRIHRDFTEIILFLGLIRKKGIKLYIADSISYS